MSNIKETLRENDIGKNGALFYHHFKKDDSHMWIYWVKHNGFGRLKLKVKQVYNDVFITSDSLAASSSGTVLNVQMN